VKKTYFNKTKWFRSASESDPDVAAKKNSITDKQNHSNSTRVNLKKLQDHILKLNTCMEEINATFTQIESISIDKTGKKITIQKK
jgi:hypothetical protein